MRMRFALQALTLSCWALVFSQSRRAPSSATKAVKAEDIGEDEANNEYFKENDDWWKDPFAMFDDEEDLDAGTDDIEFLQEPDELFDDDDEDDVSDGELLIFEPGQEDPEDIRESPLKAAAVEQSETQSPNGSWPQKLFNNEKQASKEDKSNQPVHPLVEHAMQESTTCNGTPLVSPKVRALWKALPLVNLLATFAFVKVVQPVLEHAGAAAVSTLKHSYDNDGSSLLDGEGEEEDDDELQHLLMRRMEKKSAYKNQQQQQQQQQQSREHVTQAVKRAGHTTAAAPPQPATNFGFVGNMFGKSKRNVEKLPPAKELMELVEALQRELDTLKVEKEAVEREYEKTSWSLQETQNELANLQSTTQYLKTQLRDNQEIMDRAVRAERRKARDELTKMKEAMLQVLQRERAELRAKLLKQTQEVQTILKEREKDGGGDVSG